MNNQKASYEFLLYHLWRHLLRHIISPLLFSQAFLNQLRKDDLPIKGAGCFMRRIGRHISRHQANSVKGVDTREKINDSMCHHLTTALRGRNMMTITAMAKRTTTRLVNRYPDTDC